jgi:ABC-2 type transport system ATP-binding protein
VRAVELHSLSKAFHGKSGWALHGVTMGVERGEAVALLGANGAGKTTVMEILSTLLPPSGGRAAVLDRDVVRDAASVRRAIGVVRQTVGLPPSARLSKLAHLHARLRGTSPAASRRSVAEMLRLLGLEEVASQRVRELSGGLQRRLDIGLGLLGDPPVLLLDEPAAGLDPASKARIYAELRRRCENGVAVLFTSQSLEETQELADRVAFLENGRLLDADVPRSALPALFSREMVIADPRVSA